MSKRAKIETMERVWTREQMEELVASIAALVIDRDAMTAELEDRLQNVRAEYQARLLENGSLTEEKLAIAQEWAERNAQVFGARKSIEMVHAVVGFRTGMPQLKTLAGWTWDKVKAHLLNAHLGYTRTEVSVDKEGILADRAALGEAKIAGMGVKVVQKETFFVEPKQEKISQAAG